MAIWMQVLGLVLVLQMPVAAQQAPHCATIWNGFAQSWGYPHRLARMGDGLVAPTRTDQPCRFDAFHAGATPGEADSLRFRQYSLQVEAPGVGFYPGSAQLIIDGQEGTEIRVQASGHVAHADLADPAARATLLLNGYDLRTQAGEAADQPMEFALQIDTTWVDAGTQRLYYQLSAHLNFDCQGGDCKGFEREVHYQLDVQYLAVIGKGFQVGSPEVLSSTQTWTEDSILAVQPHAGNLLAPANLPLNIPVITGFHITLSREMRLLGWETWLTPSSNAPSGLIKYNYGLGVRQWDAEMEKAYHSQQHGFLSCGEKSLVKRTEGSALNTMRIQALQFESGSATPFIWDGGLKCAGRRDAVETGADDPAVEWRE